MLSGVDWAYLFSNPKNKKGLIKLVFSYFQTDECRNLFEIPLIISNQKQPSIGILTKRCAENMQQIYWRTPIPKCDFNKVAKNWCSPVNLLHIFRTPFRKNTYGGLLLNSGENTWSITKETIEGLSISKHEADTRLVFHAGMKNEAAVVVAKYADVFLLLIYALVQMKYFLLPWYSYKDWC